MSRTDSEVTLIQPSLATERFDLRPRGLADLGASIAINSDPEVMRFLGPVWPPEKQHEHLLGQINGAARDGLGHWSIFERGGDGELLGWVMLIRSGYQGLPEIGYRLKRSAWGRGIATEAARSIMGYVSECIRLPQVVALVHRDNAASQNILKKLGLDHVGEVDRGPMPEYLFRRDYELSE